MKSRVILTSLFVCWVALMACMSATSDAAETWGQGEPAGVSAADAPVAEKVEASRKQKKAQRQLGVSIRNVRKVMKQLQADGDVDMSDAEAVADAVQTELVMAQAGNPKIDWGSIDWDKLFEFIMKIVQLFMAFM